MATDSLQPAKSSLLYIDNDKVFWGNVDGMWLPITYDSVNNRYLFRNQPVIPRGEVQSAISSKSIVEKASAGRYSVASASTGSDAYQHIKNSTPDVLLLTSMIGGFTREDLEELERIGIEPDAENPTRVLLDYAHHLNLVKGSDIHIGIILGNDNPSWLYQWQFVNKPIQPKIHRPLDERTLRMELNLGNYQQI